jgi:uncharacterized membrane protein
MQRSRGHTRLDGDGATWLSALLLIAMLVILCVAIGFLVRRLRGTWRDEIDAEPIRREMLDECFAKSEMSREDCEGRGKGLAHPREGTGSRPSADAPTQW